MRDLPGTSAGAELKFHRPLVSVLTDLDLPGTSAGAELKLLRIPAARQQAVRSPRHLSRGRIEVGPSGVSCSNRSRDLPGTSAGAELKLLGRFPHTPGTAGSISPAPQP